MSGKNTKGGRPTKAIKREVVLAIRLTRLEHYLLRGKARKAGLSLSLYLRQIALDGAVKSRLTEEERHFVRQLIGMSNNINQVAKRAHQEGLLKALLYFESYRKEIDDLIKQLRHA